MNVWLCRFPSQAGNYVKDDILSNFLRLVVANEELHAYAVTKLYLALREDISQEALVHAGLWAIGEYGDVLVRNEIIDPDETPTRVTESEVLDLVESIFKSPYTTDVGREYAMTALMKLSTRFPSQVEYVRDASEARCLQHGRVAHAHGAPCVISIRARGGPGGSAPCSSSSPTARTSSCSSAPTSTLRSSSSKVSGMVEGENGSQVLLSVANRDWRRDAYFTILSRAALLERMPAPEAREVNKQARRSGTASGLASQMAFRRHAYNAGDLPPKHMRCTVSDAEAGVSAQPAAAAAPQPQVTLATQVRLTRQADSCDSDYHRLTRSISLSLVAAASAQAASNLLDLDLLGDGPSTSAAATAAGAGTAADDILSLFGPSSTPAAGAALASRPVPAAVAVDPLADLLGGASLSAPAPAGAAPAQPAGVIGYNKNGVVINFAPQRDTSNPALVNVTCTFQNGSPAMLTNFVFQAAVPKVP